MAWDSSSVILKNAATAESTSWIDSAQNVGRSRPIATQRSQTAFRAIRILGVLTAVYMFSHAVAGMAGYYVLAEAPDAKDDEKADGDEDEDGKKKTARARAGKIPTAPQTAKKSPKGLEYNAFCPTCLPPVEDPTDPYATTSAGSSAAGATSGQFAGEVATNLPLTLVATMESDDPDFSIATIRIGAETTGATSLYSAGDEIFENVELMQVDSGLVHLSNAGRLEFLAVRRPGEPDKKPTSSAKLPTAPTTKKSKYEIDGASDAIKCNGDSCTVERKFVEQLIAQPSLLLKQGAARHYEKAGLAGMRLSRVRRGTIPKLLGLKSGDLITSINGQSLASMDNAMGLYAKLRHAKHLDVEYTRNIRGVRHGKSLSIDVI